MPAQKSPAVVLIEEVLYRAHAVDYTHFWCRITPPISKHDHMWITAKKEPEGVVTIERMHRFSRGWRVQE